MQSRLSLLQEQLKNLKCDALLLEDSLSLLYLTQLHLSAGKLLITSNSAQLLVDGRYFESAQTKSPCPVLLYEEGVLESVLKAAGIGRLAVSSEDTTYKRFSQLTEDLQKLSITVTGIDSPIKTLRTIKDSCELELLREAARLGSRGYDLVCDLLEEGITESDLAKELELFWLRQGGKKLAFDPIIAFGPNSSQPHYRAGLQRLVKGDTVLIDIGVTLNDYHSDMTRVVFFGAEPSEEMRKIYYVVKEAQEAALKICKPGATVGQLDQAARDHITSAGYGDKFTHSLGHGIGLEVHEFPTLRNKTPSKDTPLEAGMVITIEPGVYLAGTGGVRIEDTIVITPKGYEDLTLRPKELKVVN